MQENKDATEWTIEHKGHCERRIQFWLTEQPVLDGPNMGGSICIKAFWKSKTNAAAASQPHTASQLQLTCERCHWF